MSVPHTHPNLPSCFSTTPKGVATMAFSLLILGRQITAGERIFDIAHWPCSRGSSRTASPTIRLVSGSHASGSRSSGRRPPADERGSALQRAAGRSATVRLGVPGSLVGDVRRSLWRLRGSTGNGGTRGRGRQSAHEGSSVLPVCVCCHGGPGVVGRVCDRGRASRAAWPSGPVAADHGDRDRHHRAGHPELLAAGARVPGGRWLAGGGRPGVR